MPYITGTQKGNAIRVMDYVVGIEQEDGRLIKDMEPGEKGYAVQWAFDPHTNTLNERHSIFNEQQGTANMLVQKLRTDYIVTFKGDY